MRKIFFALLLTFITVFPQVAFADAQTGKCKVAGDVMSTDSVGVFMEGVCSECYREGNCSLADIEIVFANIGNFILSIVAAFVLFFYVLGGIFLMTSGLRSANAAKGKDMIRKSTFGLFIVMIAFAGVRTLESTLRGEGLGSSPGIVCDGTSRTEGEKCGPNMLCESGSCITECAERFPTDPAPVQTALGKMVSSYDCVKTNTSGAKDCQPGLCPGPADVQCCKVTSIIP